MTTTPTNTRPQRGAESAVTDEQIRRLFVEHGHLYAGWLELGRSILALKAPRRALAAPASAQEAITRIPSQIEERALVDSNDGNLMLCELAATYGAVVAWANEPEEFHHLIRFTPPELREMLLNTLAATRSPSAAVQQGEDLYLLQDTRSNIGNCPMWWAEGGKGYTSRIDKAQKYTREQALRQCQARDTDLPWALSEIEPLQRPTIDVQDLPRSIEAQRAALASAQPKTGEASRG